MGNDGGSIPSRRELVQTRAAPPSTTTTKEVLAELQAHRWTTCPLSEQELCPPIVSDCLGTLYNKAAVLEYLLPSDDPESLLPLRGDELFAEAGGASRVKSMKDVVEVDFTLLKDLEYAEDAGEPSFVCSITGESLGAGVRSIYLVPCGHPSREEAISQTHDGICAKCNQHYEPRDVISILPTQKKDLERLEQRMAELRGLGLTHSLKPAISKGKKRKQLVDRETLADAGLERRKAARLGRDTGTATQSTSTHKQQDGIRNVSSASIIAVVLQEERTRKERQALKPSKNVRSLFVQPKGGKVNAKRPRDIDFMNRGFAVPSSEPNQ